VARPPGAVLRTAAKLVSDPNNPIASNNPRAAARIDELFSDAAARLSDHPKLGKPGKISGTRELIPHESYRLVYEIEGEALWILTLIHTARLWPPQR